jgi:hypothetical protein
MQFELRRKAADRIEGNYRVQLSGGSELFEVEISETENENVEVKMIDYLEDDPSAREYTKVLKRQPTYQTHETGFGAEGGEPEETMLPVYSDKDISMTRDSAEARKMVEMAYTHKLVEENKIIYDFEEGMYHLP